MTKKKIKHETWSREQAQSYFRTGLRPDQIPEQAPDRKTQEPELTGKNQMEDLLASQIASAGLPKPERQYKFAVYELQRKWTFDFCWPKEDLELAGISTRIAVEVDGGVHRIKDKFRRELEKSRAAIRLGWSMLRFSPSEVKDGTAIGVLLEVFGGAWR